MRWRPRRRGSHVGAVDEGLSRLANGVVPILGEEIDRSLALEEPVLRVESLADSTGRQRVGQQDDQVAELGEPVVAIGTDVACPPSPHCTIGDVGDRSDVPLGHAEGLERVGEIGYWADVQTRFARMATSSTGWGRSVRSRARHGSGQSNRLPPDRTSCRASAPDPDERSPASDSCSLLHRIADIDASTRRPFPWAPGCCWGVATPGEVLGPGRRPRTRRGRARTPTPAEERGTARRLRCVPSPR